MKRTNLTHAVIGGRMVDIRQKGRRARGKTENLEGEGETTIVSRNHDHGTVDSTGRGLDSKGAVNRVATFAHELTKAGGEAMSISDFLKMGK